MSAMDIMSTMEAVAADGVRLHVETYGDASSPPLILLHGFPDSTRLWRHMIPRLCNQGHFVIAFDQRGFGASDRPADTASYRMDRLVEDAATVMDSLNVAAADVMGHDWGANVAWAYAYLNPERVRTLSVLSSGHPAYQRSIRSLEKAWYVFAFQFAVTEGLFSANDWDLFRRWARHHSECDAWIADLSRPGALHSGMNWYRANYSPDAGFRMPIEVGSVNMPVLGVFGLDDPYLEEERMRGSEGFVAGPWQCATVQAGHWLPLDAPEFTADTVTGFIAAHTDHKGQVLADG